MVKVYNLNYICHYWPLFLLLQVVLLLLLVMSVVSQLM